MNIFKKYKSNSIAVLVSVVFYGVLFILLNVIPGLDSGSNIEVQEDPIKFELIDEIAALPPLDTKGSATKKSADKSTERAVRASASKAAPASTNMEREEDLDQSNDEENTVENQDSVVLAQLKKALAVLKDIVPSDSLQKNPIEKKAVENVTKTMVEQNKTTAEDWEFIRSNYRTIQNIRKVYPYVLKTKEVIERLNSQLATITSASERHRLIKQTEKELFAQFEKDVRNMSYSQGKLLLKLLARETNQTAYGLIKTYKGGIPATFWYGVGLLFKENLKMKYDSVGEDAVLEKIIQKHKLGKF